MHTHIEKGAGGREGRKFNSIDRRYLQTISYAKSTVE